MSTFAPRLFTLHTSRILPLSKLVVKNELYHTSSLARLRPTRPSVSYIYKSSSAFSSSKTSFSPASSSVSEDEVSHFTKLASSWWDPHGPSRLLHLMNPLRHEFIQSCLATSTNTNLATSKAGKKEYSILDIGCGGGIFASSAARVPSTSSVTAIDPTPSVIAVAKAHQRSDPALSEPKLRYLNCAIEELSSHVHSSKSASQPSMRTENGENSEAIPSFDIITLFEVLEHISQPASFLDTALAHLRPGGFLVGSTIARHPLSYITTKLIAEAPLVGIVPSGTHDWDQYINPDELSRWFEKQNAMPGQEGTWGDVETRGVVYVPALGWKWVNGSERWGNYFFGIQKLR